MNRQSRPAGSRAVLEREAAVICDLTIPLPLELSFAPKLSIPQTHTGVKPLALRIGYDMHFELPGPLPTAMLFMLHVHPELTGRLDRTEQFVVESAPLSPSAPQLPPSPTFAPLPVESFLDGFGNRIARVIAPAGTLRVSYDAIYHDHHQPEPQPTESSRQHDPGELPTDVLPYLLGSRYCEIDRLSSIAWDLFGKLPAGGARALAINQWVFKNIAFGYKLTRPNKTALDTYVERTGVCRDMMHLAIACCRAMNIPARYATGYLGDIDADPDPTPMDFSAFYEVYLEGRWWPMDARHGKPRVGRVLMGRGRDATDVALLTSFGRHRLTKFTVITEEVAPPAPRTVPMTPVEPLRLSA